MEKMRHGAMIVSGSLQPQHGMWPEAARVLGHGLIVLLRIRYSEVPPLGANKLGSKNRPKTPTTLKLRGKLNGVRPGLPPELAFNRYKRLGGQPIHTYI